MFSATVDSDGVITAFWMMDLMQYTHFKEDHPNAIFLDRNQFRSDRVLTAFLKNPTHFKYANDKLFQVEFG